MNKITNTILIFVLFSSLLLAQNTEQDSIKSLINKLFKFSKVENYAQAASLLAYDGNDQSRYLISPMNINDNKEEAKVKRIVKRIKAMLDISDSFDFGEFSMKSDPKFNIYRMEVLFKSGGQELKTLFSFVKYSKTFLLTDLK